MLLIICACLLPQIKVAGICGTLYHFSSSILCMVNAIAFNNKHFLNNFCFKYKYIILYLRYKVFKLWGHKTGFYL